MSQITIDDVPTAAQIAEMLKSSAEYMEAIHYYEARLAAGRAWGIGLGGTVFVLLAFSLFGVGDRDVLFLLLTLAGIVSLVPGLVAGGPPPAPPNVTVTRREVRRAVAMYYGLYALAGLQAWLMIDRLLTMVRR